MPKYVNIPGKGEYEFPDSMSDAEIRTIVAPYFQQLSPLVTPEMPDISPPAPLPEDEPSFLGDVFGGLKEGFVGGLETAGIGAAALLPEEAEKKTVGVITSVADYLAPDPEEGDPEASVTRKLSQAVGSILTFLGPGLGARGLATAAGLGLKASQTAGLGTSAAFASAVGAGEARQRAIAEGATPEQIETVTQGGAVIGISELASVGKFFKALDTKTVNSIKDYVFNAFKTGATEGAQEAGAQIAQNLLAQKVYKPSQELIEGSGEAAAYGGAAGAILQTVLDLAIGRKAKGPQADRDQLPPEETPPTDQQQEQAIIEQQRVEGITQDANSLIDAQLLNKPVDANLLNSVAERLDIDKRVTPQLQADDPDTYQIQVNTALTEIKQKLNTPEFKPQLSEQDIVQINANANALFEKQELYEETGDNMPTSEEVNNIARQLGIDQRVDPETAFIESTTEYNDQVNKIIEQAREKLKTSEFQTGIVAQEQEPIETEAPPEFKTTTDIKPIYAHTTGSNLNEVNFETKQEIAKDINEEQPSQIKDLSYNNFEGITHTVNMEVDDAIKFTPEAPVNREAVDAIKENITNKKASISLPEIEVEIETNPRTGDIGFTSRKLSRTEDETGLRTPINTLTALKELGVKKVPVDVSVGGLGLDKFPFLVTVSNINPADKYSEFLKYRDEVGFAKLAGVKNIVSSNLDAKGKPIGRFILDLTTGKVTPFDSKDAAQKIVEEGLKQAGEEDEPKKQKVKTEPKKQKVETEPKKAKPKDVEIPTGIFNPTAEKIKQFTEDANISTNKKKNKVFMGILSKDPFEIGQRPFKYEIVGNKNLTDLTNRFSYDIAYINKDKDGKVYGLIANNGMSEIINTSSSKYHIPTFIPFKQDSRGVIKYLQTSELSAFNVASIQEVIDKPINVDAINRKNIVDLGSPELTNKWVEENKDKTLFTPQQYKELENASLTAVGTISKILTSKDGPFKPLDKDKNSQVIVSDKVQNFIDKVGKTSGDQGNIQVLLEELMKKVNMKGARVFIHDRTDTSGFIRNKFDAGFNTINFTSNRQVSRAKSESDAYGSIKAIGNDRYAMFLNLTEATGKDGKLKPRFMQTILHEWGHLVQRHTFKNASVGVQKAVMQDYAKWFERYKDAYGQTTLDTKKINFDRAFNEEKRKQYIKLEIDLAADVDNLSKGIGGYINNSEYHMSFREWFADRVSAWAITKKEPRTIVDKFFKSVGDKIKKGMETFRAWLRKNVNAVFGENYQKKYFESNTSIDNFFKEMQERNKAPPPETAIDNLKQFDKTVMRPYRAGDTRPFDDWLYNVKIEQDNLEQGLKDSTLSSVVNDIPSTKYQDNELLEQIDPSVPVSNTDINNIVRDNLDRLPKDSIPEKAKNIYRGASNTVRNVLLKVMGVDIIADSWTNLIKGKIDGKEVKPLSEFDKINKQFEGELRTLIAEGRKITDKILDYRAKNTDNGLYQALHDLFYGSTYANIDMNAGPPTKPEMDKPELKDFPYKRPRKDGQKYSIPQFKSAQNRYDYLMEEYENGVKAYRSLKSVWERVGPEGRNLYNQVRDHYSKSYDRLLSSFKNKVTDLGISENDADPKIREIFKMFNFSKRKLKFYFPLKRNGRYWVNFNIKITNEDGSISTEPVNLSFKTESQQQTARKVLEAYADANPNFINKADINDFKSNLSRGDNLHSKSTLGLKEYQKIQDIIKKNIQDVEGIDKKVSKTKFDEITNDLAEMYVSYLPERSALRSLIVRRKNVLGATGDIAEVFAASTMGQARQIARLKYTEKMEQALERGRTLLKTDLKDNPQKNAFTDVLDALGQNLDEIRSPRPGPIVTVNGKDYNVLNSVGKLGFGYYLLTPAAFMVNGVQTPTYGASLLAGRHGLQNSYRGLMRATIDVIKGGRSNRKTVNGEEVPGGLNNEESQAISQAYRDGVLDRTQLGEAGLDPQEMSTSDVVANKFMRVVHMIMNGFATIERYNREITFLAAYRLAKQNPESLSKGRDKYANPLEYAEDLTTKSHFNYSASNSGLLFKDPKFKSILMFKKYPVNMYYTWWRVINDSFADLKKEGFSDTDIKEIRSQARDQLFGLSATAFATAGLYGVPLWELWQWVLGSLFDALDEDDIDVPAGERIRNYLRNTAADIGLPEGAGELVYKGPLQSVLGIEIARRLGGGASPFSSPVAADDEASVLFKAMEVILGPVGAMAFNIEEAVDRLQREDVSFLRAIEIGMPLGLRNILKAIRFAEEETATSLAGLSIVDDVGKFQIFMQAVGFTPAEISRQFDLNNARVTLSKQANRRRLKLITKASLAVLHDDDDLYKEAMRDIRKFNNDHPNMPIKGSSIRKSARMRRRFINTNELYKLGGVSSLKPKDLQFYDDKLGFISE